MRGLAIELGLAGNVDIEQMNLVVSRDTLAARIEHERCGGHASIRCRPDRHRARHDPELELASGRCKEILDRAAAIGFADGALVCILAGP